MREAAPGTGAAPFRRRPEGVRRERGCVRAATAAANGQRTRQRWRVGPTVRLALREALLVRGGRRRLSESGGSQEFAPRLAYDACVTPFDPHRPGQPGQIVLGIVAVPRATVPVVGVPVYCSAPRTPSAADCALAGAWRGLVDQVAELTQDGLRDAARESGRRWWEVVILAGLAGLTEIDRLVLRGLADDLCPEPAPA